MSFISGQHLPSSSASFGVEGSNKYWSVLGKKVLIHLSILLTHWKFSGVDTYSSDVRKVLVYADYRG